MIVFRGEGLGQMMSSQELERQFNYVFRTITEKYSEQIFKFETTFGEGLIVLKKQNLDLFFVNYHVIESRQSFQTYSKPISVDDIDLENSYWIIRYPRLMLEQLI